MQGKEGSKDLCCVLSASIPSSDPGEREQREKGEMFLLQFLCLICNRPISLATVPAGQLTSGGTLLKLRRTGGEKNMRAAFPIFQSHPLSYVNRLRGHEFLTYSALMLFVCSDLIFHHMKVCGTVCLQATCGYHEH